MNAPKRCIAVSITDGYVASQLGWEVVGIHDGFDGLLCPENYPTVESSRSRRRRSSTRRAPPLPYGNSGTRTAGTAESARKIGVVAVRGEHASSAEPGRAR